MSCKTCDHCQAKWLKDEATGQYVHYWATGARGGVQGEKDLAALCCRPYGDPKKCINPQRDGSGGDTWPARSKFIFDKKELD